MILTHLAAFSFFEGASESVAPITSSATTYAYDWDTQSFWPMSFGMNSNDPYAIIQFEPLGTEDKSDVIFGCSDGFPRQLDNTAYQDDTSSFNSYVTIGPVKLGSLNEGIVQQLDGVLTSLSGDVTWELYAGKTYEDAQVTSGAALATGTWIAGLNATSRPRVRGIGCSLYLTNAEDNDGWSFETVEIVTLDTGRRRL